MLLSSVLRLLPSRCTGREIASKSDVLCGNAPGSAIASTWLFGAQAFLSHSPVTAAAADDARSCRAALDCSR